MFGGYLLGAALMIAAAAVAALLRVAAERKPLEEVARRSPSSTKPRQPLRAGKPSEGALESVEENQGNPPFGRS